jgi:hypothetical protein
LNKYFFTYILHFSTLLIGSLIYIFFRSETLVLFTWIGYFENIHEFVFYLRGYTVELATYFPLWFIYSFPDGMWVSSYVFLLLMIFDFKINRNNSFLIFLIPMIGLFSEFGQYFGLVSGTFDLVDILLYLVCSLIPLIILNKIIKYEI